MTDKPKPPPRKDRQTRLGEALRRNLHKRKQQIRARTANDDNPPKTKDDQP